MFVYQASLDCKNQDDPHSIWLPLSIPAQNSQHQPAWPTADWQRNFLCLSCKQVHPYTAQDVRWERVAIPENSKSEKVVASIGIECDQPNCRTLVKVFAVVRGDSTRIEAIEELKGEWFFVGVLCPHRHEINGRPADGAYRLALPDRSWLEGF